MNSNEELGVTWIGVASPTPANPHHGRSLPVVGHWQAQILVKSSEPGSPAELGQTSDSESVTAAKSMNLKHALI